MAGHPNSKAAKAAKIQFLQAHPELWEAGKKEIAKALKDAGLLSPKTAWIDVQLDKLLAAARADASRGS